MKKPPSRARRAIRDIQLVLCAGFAMLTLYAVCTSALEMNIQFGPVQSSVLRLIIQGLLSHGTLLVLAPAICFGVRRVVDIDPWRLGIGATAFVQLSFLALRWVVGGFDEEGFDALLGIQLGLTAAACVLAGLAAQLAARQMARGEAADAEALAANPAAAPRPDLAEEMRRIQDAARAQPSAPAEAESAPPAELPKA